MDMIMIMIFDEVLYLHAAVYSCLFMITGRFYCMLQATVSYCNLALLISHTSTISKR